MGDNTQAYGWSSPSHRVRHSPATRGYGVRVNWYEQAYSEEGRRRPRWGASALLVIAFIVVAISAVLAVVRVPYVVMSPGPVADTLGSQNGQPLVSVSGAKTYPTEGHLWFTTVNVLGGPQRHITGWEALRAAADPNADLLPEDQVFPPGTTDQQIEQQNADEMVGSQEAAVAVALRSAGKTVKEAIQVAGVSDLSPGKGKIHAGDVLTAVDGTKVSTVQNAVAAIRKRNVGDPAAITVRRDDQVLSFTLKTVDVQGKPAVGLLLQPKYTFPFTVKIDAGQVGGPSAGMMFSLAVRDLVTPGAMTGGQPIAGTGTISDGGEVGPIGGIRFKLVGARRAGASWFLAPKGNCGEVVNNIPDGLHVVAVTTHAEAAHAVEQIAAGKGASLPGCS